MFIIHNPSHICAKKFENGSRKWKLKMKRERQTEREKILLEIISNSTLVLTKIMKKKKREKSRVMMWVKD